MTTTTLTRVTPIQGVPDGASSTDPTVRERWLEQRRGGITATEIRDWGIGTKRREILTAKVTGVETDIDSVVVRNGSGFTLGDYARHGKLREPMIADWIERKFGIAPCEHVYGHGENPRYLASPDGVSLDPFSKELIIGVGAALSEIKTATKDLHPGVLDDERVLVKIDQSSAFASKNYYSQMQWQMFVMNADRTLFVWEQHDGKVDPETGTFTPIGVPQYAWIPRDQGLIDQLVIQADKALAEIDAARVTAAAGSMPPATAQLNSEDAALVAELLAARTDEAVAKKRKDTAWAALQARHLGDGKQDFTIKEPGFANVTVSTSTSMRKEVDREGMKNKAPKMVAQYEALEKRFTKDVPVTTQKLTVTENKGK